MLTLCEKNDKIVGITAAMPGGTGLTALMEKYPDRFWDAAIAEQHAVTSMGALAVEGFKPFCTIYSTFMQRGYDQVIHDVCLMDLPVVFAMDRAGTVGEDGETHQGAFDVSFMRAIPNMRLCAPRDELSFHQAINFASQYGHPLSLRYPRGAFMAADLPESVPFEEGKAQLLIESKGDILFIGYGNGVGRAAQTSALMDEEIALFDLRFVKPLDEAMLKSLAQKHKKWFIFSDSAKMGGVGSAILEFLADEKIKGIELTSFEYNDAFITHGSTKLVEESLGLSPERLVERVKAQL
jgi:1-deoxy-D-xylulose-5-phosphate synthase